MMRYRRDAYEFEKIYLPDVFSGPEMKYTLALLLLADVTKKASLPGRRVSLFALAEALCARRVKIDLLSRGSEFEGKYTALWPDLSEVSRETEDVFNSLIENHENAMTELVNIAEEVRQLFLSMTEEMPEAEQKSAPLSEASLVEEDTEGSERSLTGQTEPGGENEGYTQEKLELIMEDTGAAAEDTAEAPEEAEKREHVALNRKSWKRNSVNYRQPENFRHFWKVRKNRGIFCVSSATRSVWHFRIPATAS